jgi:hypothetical protein
MWRVALGGFAVAHGLIHASFLSPQPRTEPGAPAWPFHLDRSWLLSRLGAFPVRRGESDEDSVATALGVLERGVRFEGLRVVGQVVGDGGLRELLEQRLRQMSLYTLAFPGVNIWTSARAGPVRARECRGEQGFAARAHLRRGERAVCRGGG